MAKAFHLPVFYAAGVWMVRGMGIRNRQKPVCRAGKRPLAISGLAVWWYSLLCTPPGSAGSARRQFETDCLSIFVTLCHRPVRYEGKMFKFPFVGQPMAAN